jgi:hypothetical protein
MAQSAPAQAKINTKVTQPAPGRSSRRPAGRPGPGRPPRGPRVSGDARESVRQPDRPVIERDFGILVYPPETEGEPWRAVFTGNGQRRFRQGATEAKLAGNLEKVKEKVLGTTRISRSASSAPEAGPAVTPRSACRTADISVASRFQSFGAGGLWETLEFLANPLGGLYLGTAIRSIDLRFRCHKAQAGKITDTAPVMELARYRGERIRKDTRTATVALAAIHR